MVNKSEPMKDQKKEEGRVIYYRIQGLESSIYGSRELFFHNSEKGSVPITKNGFILEGGKWIGTGTFRNALYIEPWRQLSTIDDLFLIIEYSGAIFISVHISSQGRNDEILMEEKLVSASKITKIIPIGSIADYPENSRIFWSIEGLVGGAEVYDISYHTKTKPTAPKLGVLLRTFGRTQDIKTLLLRIIAEAKERRDLERILSNIDFWVLDTSISAEDGYKKEVLDQLNNEINLNIFVAPNLGGGGNAGHLLRLLNEDYTDKKRNLDELLILDDDLSISLETIARYYSLISYRAKEFLCSLPILMRSRPTVIWEDGGFWGRLMRETATSMDNKRTLSPHLLKHGIDLSNRDTLNLFTAINFCEYSTFIFFGISMSAFEKIGYPASFFLRGDDVEISLRAMKHGLPMITNPNLAAWHEPAHSYGQEYMAILHAVIINLTYSDNASDFYFRFFEERLHEHSALNDINGVTIYSDVLKELTRAEPEALSLDFESHYIEKISYYNKIKFIQIPESERNQYEESLRHKDILLVPFLYPGYKKPSKEQKVIAFNPSSKSYREIPQNIFSDKISACIEYMESLKSFSAHFNEIKTMWQNRLIEASSEEYWKSIHHKHKKKTRLIFSSLKNNNYYNGEGALEFIPRDINDCGNKALHAKEIIYKSNELPDDFDPEHYLIINKDIAESGIDPIQHYINYGMYENRRYR